MKRANEYRAYFSMSGDFNPDEITAGIGLTPTRTLMKGSVHEKTRHIQKFSIWSLNSRLDQFASLEDQIADVLEQLRLRADTVRALVKIWGGCMQLVGKFYVDYPGLHFESALVSGIAEFGLSVDFDFYHYWAEMPETN